MSETGITDARRRGFEAGQRGGWPSNPYPFGGRRWRAWARGFEAGAECRDRKQRLEALAMREHATLPASDRRGF